MKDYIAEIYEALENFDCERIGKIYFGVRDGKISVSKEDIVPLCELFLYEFQDTDPVNEQVIIDITYHIIDVCEKEKCLKELVKGLITIYNKSIIKYENSKIPGNTYEGLLDYILQYINTFLASYGYHEVEELGKIIGTCAPLDFKDRIVEMVEKSIADYEDERLRKLRRITEDIVKKGKLLISNIK